MRWPGGHLETPVAIRQVVAGSYRRCGTCIPSRGNKEHLFTALVASVELCHMARATTEMHPFLAEIPRFGNLRYVPKTDLEVIKPLPDAKSHGLGTQREPCKSTTYLRRGLD